MSADASLPTPTLRQRARATGAAVLGAALIALAVMLLPPLLSPYTLVLDTRLQLPTPELALPAHWERHPDDPDVREVRCDWHDGGPAGADDERRLRCEAQGSFGAFMTLPSPLKHPDARVRGFSASSTLDADGYLAWTLGPCLAVLGLALAIGRRRPWRADLAAARPLLRRPGWLLLPLAVSATIALAAQALGLIADDPATRALLVQPPLVAAMLLAPFWEELLLRGWLWQRLRATLPWWLTALLSTELFVALHAANPQMGESAFAYVASLTGAGFALAWLRERFDSVVVCIGAHWLQNASAAGLLLLAGG